MHQKLSSLIQTDFCTNLSELDKTIVIALNSEQDANTHK